MRLTKLWTAFVAAAVTIGLAGASAAPAAAEDGTATITGTVTLKGQQLAGQRILVDVPGETVRHATTTDEAGAFSVAVSPGTYRVRVGPPIANDDDDETGNDYEIFEPGLEYFPTFGGDTVHERLATLVAVAAGETATIDITPVPAGVLRGRVVGHDGKPLARVDIFAINTTRSASAEARTDSKGRFTLVGLATGPVRMWLSRHPAYVKVNADAVQGETKTLKDIKVDKRTGSLKATVKRLKKGDKVHVVDLSTLNSTEIIKAKKNGTLKISVKVAAGKYRLEVKRLNLRSKDVRVRAGKKVDVGTVHAPSKRSKLSGVVKGSDGKPVKNVQVELRNRYDQHFRSVRTDAKGRYSFEKLGRGTYRVLAWDRTLRSGPKDVRVKLANGSRAKQNFRLFKAYTVSGKVVHEGKPVPGLHVQGLAHGGRVFVEHVRTDEDGSFTLRGMPRGSARLSVSDTTRGGFLDRRKTITVPLTEDLTLTVKR